MKANEAEKMTFEDLRRAYLSGIVALMAKRYHLDDMDATVCVFIAAMHMAAGNTAASAYDQARHLAIRINQEKVNSTVVSLINRIKANTPAIQAG